MVIGVAFESKAYRVTVCLGGAKWEYYDRRVSVDKERGIVQILAADTNRLLASAPMNATFIEWVKDSGALTNQPGRERLNPTRGTPSVGELESAVDDWLRVIGG